MKAKVRTFNGTTSPEVTQRETDHRKLARESAAEEETISAEENFDENDVETAEKAGDEE